MLILGKDPENKAKRILCHEKSSLAATGQSISFEINPGFGGILFSGYSELKADDILDVRTGTRNKPSKKRDDLIDDILELFGENDYIKVPTVEYLCKQLGCSPRTLYRARDELGIQCASRGYKLTTYLRYPMQNRFNAMLGYRHRNPLNVSGSLNVPVGEDDDSEIIELTPDPYSGKPFERIEQDDFTAYWHAQLDGAMQRRLDRQQKDIVYDFYFARLPKAAIAEKHGLPYSEVNNILQVSRTELRRDYELRMRYRDEIILDGLYKGTGLSAFRNSQMSSVEHSVEMIERKTAELTTETLQNRTYQSYAEKQTNGINADTA